MSVPISEFIALIDVAECDQVAEIEEYLRKNGVEVPQAVKEAAVGSNSSDKDKDALVRRLLWIIEHCRDIFKKDLPQQEAEEFFYTVISLIHLVPEDQTTRVVDLLCQQVIAGATPENGPTLFRILGLILSHLPIENPICHTVFCRRIELAQKVGLVSTLVIDVVKLKHWVECWSLNDSQKRELYQLVWSVCKDSDDKSLCSKLLIELLRCYPLALAGQVRELVERLVVLVVSDSQLFIFDHVLKLEPVQALKSEKIHQLLEIFVCGKFCDYVKFYSEHEEFVDALGLDHTSCIRKMRLLTLTSLSVGQSEVPFSVLTSELNLEPEGLEMLIIDAVRMKLLCARINQVESKLMVMSSIHRTFGNERWSQLRENIASWKQKIHLVRTGLQAIKT